MATMILDGHPHDKVTIAIGGVNNPDYKALQWWCPGCKNVHSIPVRGTDGPMWSWNDSIIFPTLKPSILKSGYGPKCHSYVTAGVVRFLKDCEHDLAGKTVPMLVEHADPFRNDEE